MWVIVLCKRIVAFIFAFIFAFPSTVYAQGISISADNAVVYDKISSSVLYQKNSDKRVAMASTTKIMTCLIACEKLNADDVVIISDNMLKGTEGSLIYLKAGDKISVYDLIKGAMLASGNDAANALAVYIGGSIESFVSLMNYYAKAIGMESTSFATPSGLDSAKHYSTAYDMAKLTAYALDNELFKSVCSMQKADISINGKTQTIYNHNKLLYQIEDCIGVKTGFTTKAGRCLVTAYDYKGNTVIIVTLNDCDDWNDHKKLYDYAKRKYKTLAKNEIINISIVGANESTVSCVAKYDISYFDDISIKYYYYPILYAPVLQNTVVGKVKIYSNNRLIGTVDIIAQESVKAWQTTR